jgi:DNA-binding transcriptional ArsR family regulator
LAVLRKNGLIIARKEGKWVHYSLNPVRFVQLKDYIRSFSLAKNTKSKC